jgi:hypothetical protein
VRRHAGRRRKASEAAGLLRDAPIAAPLGQLEHLEGLRALHPGDRGQGVAQERQQAIHGGQDSLHHDVVLAGHNGHAYDFGHGGQRGSHLLHARHLDLHADEDGNHLAEQAGVDHGGDVNDAAVGEPLEPLAHRALGDPQLAGDVDVGDAAIALQDGNEPAVQVIQGIGHEAPPDCELRIANCGPRDFPTGIIIARNAKSVNNCVDLC